ncbi:MAG: hypothetical protein M3132_08485, partial [Actinomycetia bacterium]|nr:hypothetical protein [Actinomycetes bacterium]
ERAGEIADADVVGGESAAELDRVRVELDERESELKRRASELDERAAEIADADVVDPGTADDLERKRIELEDREADLGRRSQVLDDRMEQSESRQAEIEGAASQAADAASEREADLEKRLEDAALVRAKAVTEAESIVSDAHAAAERIRAEAADSASTADPTSDYGRATEPTSLSDRLAAAEAAEVVGVVRGDEHPDEGRKDIGGMSLSDRLAAAEAAEVVAGGADGIEFTDDGDSIEAIRIEAMRALEEARVVREHARDDDAIETTDQQAESPVRPVLDYSPSVPAPVKSEATDSEDEDEDEDEPELVESRYSRNSAKLPRIGIEPGSSSDTIANLRRQMTSDN